MLNQALKTMDLQLFAENADDGSGLFAEEGAAEKKPAADALDTMPEETEAGKPGKEELTKAEDPAGLKRSDTIRIKYNGEEKDITVEEAVTLAQKGMNYDKVMEKLRAAENAEELKILDAAARQSGLTRKEYVKRLQSRFAEDAVGAEMKDIKARHPGVSDELAKELAEARIKYARRETEEREKQEQERLRQEQLRPWQEFRAAYPDVKDIQSLPEQVLRDIAEGDEPVRAMRKYELCEAKKEIEDLKQRLQIKEKNEHNITKAIGSAASSSGESPIDAFESALFG